MSDWCYAFFGIVIAVVVQSFSDAYKYAVFKKAFMALIDEINKRK